MTEQPPSVPVHQAILNELADLLAPLGFQSTPVHPDAPATSQHGPAGRSSYARFVLPDDSGQAPTTYLLIYWPRVISNVHINGRVTITVLDPINHPDDYTHPATGLMLDRVYRSLAVARGVPVWTATYQTSTELHTLASSAAEMLADPAALYATAALLSSAADSPA